VDFLYASPVDSSRSTRLFVFKDRHCTGLPEPDSARRAGGTVRVFLLSFAFRALLLFCSSFALLLMTGKSELFRYRRVGACA
jgi:hypothetical protein